MTDRAELPQRRPQALLDFAVGGATFTVGLGFASPTAMRRGDDPLEVFLSCSRTTDIAALGRDVAVLVSLARQHGCSFDVMRDAITRTEDPTRPTPPGERGPPASLVGRLLDEIEAFTREEAVALAEKGF